MSIVDEFEKDCLVRIEKRCATPAAPESALYRVDEQYFPSATYFLMGVGFGVIAARVACTCIVNPRPE